MDITLPEHHEIEAIYLDGVCLWRQKPTTKTRRKKILNLIKVDK